MNIVVATNNLNKLREIREMLGHKFDNIYSLKDLGIDVDIVEDADTFLGNAIIKAKAIAKMAKMTAIADDSGLIVDALDGAPGVYSARYAGEPCDDERNNQLLLKNMENVTERTARFVSSVVLYHENDEYIYGEGSVEGEILHEYRGDGGFGYDPLFYCTELKKTFGEANSQEKNSISHRARALAKLLEAMK